MSYLFDSRLGKQLYQLLPEVYRTRDKKAESAGGDSSTEDLAKYLDAHGHLLDLIHATLEQQLKDALPESSQDWLLPYFAQLLAADTVSPESDGRHAEVANAISWRQRKGTLKCAEEIAEAVGQMEVEIQEGWKRLAMTPRIGMPMMPSKASDNTLDLDMSDPSAAIRHPALPAAMVDLRRSSRAVEASSTNPAARLSNFAGVKQNWRQANPHGVPCFPGSFDDVSRRTVDMRTSCEIHGQYHHKRLLAFALAPTGLFPLDSIKFEWAERNGSEYKLCIDEKEENGVWVIRNKTNRIIEISDEVLLAPIEISDELLLRQIKVYRIEGINFKMNLSVEEGTSLDLQNVEALKVQVDTFSSNEPVLTANDCLFVELSCAGPVKLDSCTVLEKAHLTSIQALDCILMEILGTDVTGSIEYSRIPDDQSLSSDTKKMSIKNHQSNLESDYGYDPVTEAPSFITGQSSITARAVLSPKVPKSIYEGASDHGEMGYYHRGRVNRPVKIDKEISFSLPADGGYPLTDVIFEKDVTVNSGQLILIRSAAPTLLVKTPLNNSGAAVASLLATDCLFQNVNVTKGLARLEYCTIMETANCKYIQASECIFVGMIMGVKKPPDNSFLNCLRFSSISPGFLDDIKNKPENSSDKKLARALQLIDTQSNIMLRTNTFERPVFEQFVYCKDHEANGVLKKREAVYGEYGYGVSSSQTPRAIRFGAEDGGEIGSYHHRYYALKAEAMLEKMREFLPVGINPVLILDKRLLHVPPENKNSSNGGVS